LIGALKYRDPIAFEIDSYDVAEAAALLLGAYGLEAKVAVSALIDALRTREEDDANWIVRRTAALALGQIGRDAKAVIPVLHDILKEKPCPIWDGVVIALHHLDPEVKLVAQRWVETPRQTSELYPLHGHPGRRENVLGAMGRTSLDADVLTGRSLVTLNRNLAIASEEDELGFPYCAEEYFEAIGRLGIGARLAIPRLEELRKHHNAWVRLWATETLAKVRPAKS
jgi:HEAT repeat protein